MRSIPAFLAHLALDAEADPRAIRRAYARKLKQLDQDADPQAFQSLREAYEAALAWTERRSHVDVANDKPKDTIAPPASETPSAAPPAHDVPPVAIQPDAHPFELARAVFADLERTLAPRVAAKSGKARWIEDLTRALADERLFNVGARLSFEALVVDKLAAGYQPGNERLFRASVLVFRWEADPRRLLPFGQAGALLSRAIDEALLFKQQAITAWDAQCRALEMLRSPQSPGQDDIRAQLEHIQVLMTRFPSFARVNANMANAPQWAVMFEQLPKIQPKAQSWWSRLPRGRRRVLSIVLLLGLAISLLIFEPSPRRPPTDDERMLKTLQSVGGFTPEELAKILANSHPVGWKGANDRGVPGAADKAHGADKFGPQERAQPGPAAQYLQPTREQMEDIRSRIR